MKTLQPSFWCIANQGDVNPLEHGGKFIFVDRRGIYFPLLVLLKKESDKEWKIFEIELERCFVVRDNDRPIGIGANVYHTQLCEWFGEFNDVKGVSGFGDVNLEEVMELFVSSSPLKRAFGYGMLADYYGADAFDHYPRTLTRADAKKYVAKCLKQIHQSESWHDGMM